VKRYEAAMTRILLVLALFGMGCAKSQTPVAQPSAQVTVDPGAAAPVAVTKAIAVLAPTKGNEVAGVMTFEQTADGVKLHAEVSGLPPGKHAYHVHIFGDCSSEDGSKAGTHFHFTGSAKEPGEHYPHITGDLGDLDAGADGKATADAVIKDASLQGAFSILGRSVIVHEKPNDPKQPPMGGAGGRLACGVIGLTE
jgi:Cu-Zn family superoxide dismutase